MFARMRVCFACFFFFSSCRRALLGAVQSIVVPARFCFHFANAYEDPENGEVVLDMVEASYLKLDNEVESEEPVWDTIGEGLGGGGRERGEREGHFFFSSRPCFCAITHTPCDDSATEVSHVGGCYCCCYCCCGLRALGELSVVPLLAGCHCWL